MGCRNVSQGHPFCAIDFPGFQKRLIFDRVSLLCGNMHEAQASLQVCIEDVLRTNLDVCQFFCDWSLLFSEFFFARSPLSGCVDSHIHSGRMSIGIGTHNSGFFKRLVSPSFVTFREELTGKMTIICQRFWVPYENAIEPSAARKFHPFFSESIFLNLTTIHLSYYIQGSLEC